MPGEHVKWMTKWIENYRSVSTKVKLTSKSDYCLQKDTNYLYIFSRFLRFLSRRIWVITQDTWALEVCTSYPDIVIQFHAEQQKVYSFFYITIVKKDAISDTFRKSILLLPN